MFYQGDYLEDATVYVMFNTFTSNDPSASSTITNFANTDVHVHKDDGLTQRNNAAGITVSVNFDGITGSHMIAIDTSDDTVGGFWVTGSDYFVRIEGTTVDAGIINSVVGHFSIENRFKEVDLTHIMGTILTEGSGSQLADAFIKLFDVATPLLVASDVMVGTDGANTTVPDTSGTAAGLHGTTDGKVDAIQADIGDFSGRTNNQSLLAVLGVPDVAAKDLTTLLVTDRLDEGTFGLSALQALLAAIPTTAMRGTDNAALASVLGTLADAAADGDPTNADTAIQYLKQVINVLMGTAGIVAFPAEQPPGNAVSLAEVIRAIHADVTGIAGVAMRGTDGANTTTPPTVGQIQAEMEEDGASILDTLQDRITGLLPTKAQMDTAHGLLATEAKQDIIDGVVDSILVDTTLLDKWLKNKITFSGTSMVLFDDDNSTPLLTWTLSEGSTSVSGPYNRAKAT